jgi:flavodoxin
MKGLVVYDSKYGNTGFIAEAIAAELKYKAVLVSEIHPERLLAYEHVIIGSPTHMSRPTDTMINFLIGLPSGVLSGVNFTCFSTCLDIKNLSLKDRGFNLYDVHKQSNIKLPKHIMQSLPNEVQERLANLESLLLPKNRPVLPNPPSLIMPSHAAQIMSLLMHEAGATAMGKPQDFYVDGIEGPIKEGELDHAAEWANTLSH